ncbi:MAG: BrnA antitoxin family protein [Candidatus Marinimicrobia bacterium]|nr:BrnA antitoxin family protein [Candidatus Neomarinimicrobiota bacterium]
MKRLKDIPKFENEDQEREFWSEHDTTDYLDWSKGDSAVFPKLKPTSRTISLRLPAYLLEELRAIARKRDVPYQSLIKMFLKERIDQEYRSIP